MARIAGVDLPRDKRVEIGLTYIYGVGLTSSKEILRMTGVNPDVRIKDLDEVTGSQAARGDRAQLQGGRRSAARSGDEH